MDNQPLYTTPEDHWQALKYLALKNTKATLQQKAKYLHYTAEADQNCAWHSDAELAKMRKAHNKKHLRYMDMIADIDAELEAMRPKMQAMHEAAYKAAEQRQHDAEKMKQIANAIENADMEVGTI